MADFSDLDAAFHLPEQVASDSLRELFEVLVGRLRAESDQVPMSTAQILRGERMVTEYVLIKHRETLSYGLPGAYQHAGQEKDSNLAWRAIAKDWDDILQRTKPGDRQSVLGEVKAAIVEVLGTIEDGGQRNELTSRFVATFDRLGI